VDRVAASRKRREVAWGKTSSSRNYWKSANNIERSSCVLNVIPFLFAFRNVRLKRQNLIHSATQWPGVPLFGFMLRRKRSRAWDPFLAGLTESELFPKSIGHRKARSADPVQKIRTPRPNSLRSSICQISYTAVPEGASLVRSSSASVVRSLVQVPQN